mmetsp:Transcript_10318/g.43929  ORF Transcript_10318/g.43929 Transcript_10318/m.43929 type:complete len:260 (+) Transcript_10318:758-1537(+)
MQTRRDHSLDVLFRAHGNHGGVLHGDPPFAVLLDVQFRRRQLTRIPTAATLRRRRRRRRQQVVHGILVQLEHVRRHADGDFALLGALGDDAAHLLDGARGETRVRRVAVHGVRLPAARLAVGKYAHVVPVKRALDEVLRVLENLRLGRVGTEHAVEVVRTRQTLVPPRVLHRERVRERERERLVLPLLLLGERPRPRKHANLSLHVLDGVEVLLAKRALFLVLRLERLDGLALPLDDVCGLAFPTLHVRAQLAQTLELQ